MYVYWEKESLFLPAVLDVLVDDACDSHGQQRVVPRAHEHDRDAEAHAQQGEGPGKVLMPLRVVVTGQARGAELYNVISIIGRDRTLNRIKNTVVSNM